MLAISPRGLRHTILQAAEPNFYLLCYLGGGVKLRKDESEPFHTANCARTPES